MESSSTSKIHSNGIAKKLLHMFKVAYYMLRKGIFSKRKLMMDLHILLKRGKLAGKALGNLMTFHGHHTDHSPSSAYSSSSSFSCLSMDPNLSFYNPREVEFSCSNTPSFPVNITSRRKHHRSGSSSKNYSYDYDAVAAIAKAFEMLNNDGSNMGEISDQESVLPSPSPMIAFGKSPATMARQLRITDSPFPLKEDEAADGRVDKEAEEFIRRFYEQLRMQPATPEYSYRFRRGA